MGQLDGATRGVPGAALVRGGAAADAGLPLRAAATAEAVARAAQEDGATKLLAPLHL